MSIKDKKVEIKLKVTKIKTEPAINVVTITTETETGTWPETFGSAEKAEGFLLGLKVMASLVGRLDISIPSIPREMYARF